MTTTQKKSPISDTFRGLNEMTLSNEDSRALVNAAQTWFAATTECHREMIGFVSMRFEKDGQTFREMMNCKNLADVTSVHSRWAEETLRDYNSEMTKLVNICTRSVNGGGRSEK